MTEKDKIGVEKVKWNGVFDFKELYQFVYRWLDEEGYDIAEEKYQESVKGDAKDIEIEWVAEKELSDYFKIELKLSWIVLGLKSVEVEKDGKRFGSNKGGLEIKIVGALIRDYQNKWDSSSFARFLRGVYDKYIIEGTLKGYEDKVAGDIDDMAEQIKAFVTIEGMK
tara:strand:+ start:5420 stop:5920 length:501 start_codon:yes stop_codon:yes gene_type:complete